MPVIDWTRTDLKHQLPNGSYALRFDQDRFTAFDLFILKRDGAEKDYSQSEIARAKTALADMSKAEQQKLTETIIAGLPGKMTDAHSIEGFRQALARYEHLDHAGLRANLLSFLKAVLPHADRLGIKLAIHPDDHTARALGENLQWNAHLSSCLVGRQ